MTAPSNNADRVEKLWEQIHSYSREKYTGFENLMQVRIRNILLVASVYDSFTLEEGGRLTELILTEYRELNLSQVPIVIRATSGREALTPHGRAAVRPGDHHDAHRRHGRGDLCAPGPGPPP